MAYESRRRFLAFVRHAAALLLFSALAILHTWPAALFLDGYVISGREDVWMNVWHIWWMRQSLWENPQNPFHSDLLGWPEGADFYWHTLSPGKNGLGALLSTFCSYTTAYNLLVLSSFVFSAYTAWLLFRWILREAKHEGFYADLSAAGGASVFAFSRYHLGQGLSHLNLTAMEGIPLFLLGFFAWSRYGKLRHLALVAVSVVYLALCEYYYVAYVAVFAAAWVIADRWQRGPLISLGTLRDHLVRRQLVAGVVSAIVLSPVLLMLVTHMANLSASTHGDTEYFADLVGYILPDNMSKWNEYMPIELRAVVERVTTLCAGPNFEEATMFLGFLSLLFPLWIGLRNRVPAARRWFGVGLLFLVLACGKELAIGGTTTISPGFLLLFLFVTVYVSPAWRNKTWRRDVLIFLAVVTLWAFALPFTAEKKIFTVTVPMPFIIFKSVVPLFSKAGMPVRLAAMATLAFGALYAFFGVRVAQTFGRRRAVTMVLLLVLIAIPNVELLSYSWPMHAVPKMNNFFRTIRDDKERVAVMSDNNILAQYEQTMHGRPITLARLSRIPESIVQMQKLPVFQALQFLKRIPYGYTDNEVDVMRDYLRVNHIKYYTFHMWHPAFGSRDVRLKPMVEDFILRRLGGRKIFSDEDVVGFQFY